jgi:hypothetical protein
MGTAMRSMTATAKGMNEAMEMVTLVVTKMAGVTITTGTPIMTATRPAAGTAPTIAISLPVWPSAITFLLDGSVSWWFAELCRLDFANKCNLAPMSWNGNFRLRLRTLLTS